MSISKSESIGKILEVFFPIVTKIQRSLSTYSFKDLDNIDAQDSDKCKYIIAYLYCRGKFASEVLKILSKYDSYISVQSDDVKYYMLKDFKDDLSKYNNVFNVHSHQTDYAFDLYNLIWSTLIADMYKNLDIDLYWKIYPFLDCSL